MVSRECTICKKVKDIAEFYLRKSGRDKGKYYSRCKQCCCDYKKTHKRDTKEYEKKYNKENRESITLKQKEKRRRTPVETSAHYAVRSAMKNGVLTKEPCAVCGAKRTDAHHDDYTKKLEVIWLCRKHHFEKHYLHGV